MENKPVVTVSFQPAKEDFLDLWKSSPFKYFSWFLIPVAAFYAYWALAIFMNNGFTQETSFTITLFCVVTALAFGGGLLLPRLRERVTYRGPIFHEPRSVSMASEGIKTESPSFTAAYKWSAFSIVKESKKSFLLFTGPTFALVIPKRSFSSPEHLQHARALIKECFPGKKRLRE